MCYRYCSGVRIDVPLLPSPILLLDLERQVWPEQADFDGATAVLQSEMSRIGENHELKSTMRLEL